MTSHSQLEDVLAIFKRSREKLVSGFLNEDVEMFESMFKYENDEEIMTLSREKYVLGYINNHFIICNDYDHVDDLFWEAMLDFLKLFSLTSQSTKITKGNVFFESVLNDKQEYLQKLIKASDKSSDSFNKLSYQYEKDKALFDREISKIGM